MDSHFLQANEREDSSSQKGLKWKVGGKTTDKIHPQSLKGCSLCILPSNASHISNRDLYLPVGALSDSLVNAQQSSAPGRGVRWPPLTQHQRGTSRGTWQARLASPGDTADKLDPSAF